MRRYSLLILIASFVIVLSSCKKDKNDGPTAEDLQKEKLSFTWNVSSVSLDGTDVTSSWSGFTLSITTSSGNGYSTTNSFDEGVWPISGTWRFQSNEGAGLEVIIRDDNVSIDIEEVTESTLRLSFSYIAAQAQQSSRVKGVEGDYVFNLVN